MKTIFLKIVLVAVIFAVGYALPSLLQFDKKMEFASSSENYKTLECQLINKACEQGEYRIELIKGNFASAQKTIFKINRNGQPIKSEVLVTSDDNLFGTIVSQIPLEDKRLRQILIPYCGNPVMQVIVIDQENKQGLVINNLPQES